MLYKICYAKQFQDLLSQLKIKIKRMRFSHELNYVRLKYGHLWKQHT